MGRSSVEATKACLMRAVRAVLAALPGRVLRRALEVADFPGVPVFFDEAGFAVPDGFFAADVVPVFDVVPGWVGFVFGFGFVVADVAGFVVLSVVDWAAIGVAASRMESRPHMQIEASRIAKFGEAKTLICSLYAAFSPS
jgi:hypothetical protein